MKKHFKNKTWIDWVKALVAFDIAIVGLSLVLQNEMHILANMFGSVSRFIFGVLYIIVAIAILKGVFPELIAEFNDTAKDTDNSRHTNDSESNQKHTSSRVGEMIEKGTSSAKNFISDRAHEAKQELHKILD